MTIRLVFINLMVFFLAILPTIALGQRSVSVLTTESGVPLKVVVRYNTAIYETCDKKSRSSPATAMDFFYCLPVDKAKGKLKDGFYNVSTGTSSISSAGWIHQEDVIEWPHRQMLGFRKQEGRQKAHFYKNLQDLGADYALNKRSSDRAIGRELESSARFLFPILSEIEVLNREDKIICYEVAYLHGKRPGNGNYGGESKAISLATLQSESILDFAIVVDATSSMEIWIKGVKEAIISLSKTLADDPVIKKRLRFGLVAFRDRGEEFATKVVCPFIPATEVTKFVESLDKLSTAGGGDIPEQGLAGIKTALTELKWSAVGFRHLLLVGDAPSHDGPPSGLVSFDEVMDLAQPKGDNQEFLGRQVTIHCLQVGQDNEAARRQFTMLSEGRNGLNGMYSNFDDVGKFTKDLANLLHKPTVAIGSLIDGKFDDVINSKEPVLKGMIEQLKAAGESGLASTPTFGSGFVAMVDPDGHQMMEPQLLVTNGQLRLFHATIGFMVATLEGAGDPGSKDVTRVLDGLKLMATNLNIGEPISGDTPLDKVIQIGLGLPVKSRIFKMTPKQLVQMSQKDFLSWVAEMHAVEGIIRKKLDNHPEWFSLGSDKRLENRHCVIRISELP